MPQDSTDWIDWQGGDCPVDKNVMVRVQGRFEAERDEHQMPRRASGWVWSHDPKDALFDIIAYCVVHA